ncbi:type II toxin-antitoxin system PemK/MazF family toxin [Thalassococcus sp. BH17M4-6]|uniref:type II toxin-antitoxin system PemK/MazF family toxin n=1 Tax=Thalassococcus sp. BH17M4-6 TaxID=3413148 RepID=UPI003BE30D68
MPIRFHPGRGAVLRCNYSTGGFMPPEMVKVRPAVVLCERPRRNKGLLTVVPLSTTAPTPQMDYHCKVSVEDLPGFPVAECWVKADMIATVAFHRLDMFRLGRCKETGKRQYMKKFLSPEDLEKVQECVRVALGL